MASRSDLAVAYRDGERIAEAIPLLKQAIAECERVLGTDQPNTLAFRSNLADAYQAAADGEGS